MKKSLIKLYKSLNDKPLHEQFPEDDEYAKHMKSSSTQMTGDAFGKKTYGDLSPEEWEVEREKYGIKTHPDGHKYVSREYDPGNEPLQIQTHEGEEYFIEPEDIEAYVNGEEVLAIDPDRGADPKWVTRDDSDVIGVSEDELEDFLVSGDRSADDIDLDVDDDDRFSGMDDVFGADLEEQEEAADNNEDNDTKGQPFPAVGEGTCGHAPGGAVDIHNTDRMKPAGSHLLKITLSEVKRLQKLANIK